MAQTPQLGIHQLLVLESSQCQEEAPPLFMWRLCVVAAMHITMMTCILERPQEHLLVMLTVTYCLTGKPKTQFQLTESY